MKFVVVGKTSDEIHGRIEESEVRSKEFDTYEEAAYCREIMHEERYISGQRVYFNLIIDCVDGGEQ